MAAPSLMSRLVPYWLKMDALRWRIIIRASVASFACCLTFLVRPSLNTNGVAAFLPLIVSQAQTRAVAPDADAILAVRLHQAAA